MMLPDVEWSYSNQSTGIARVIVLGLFCETSYRQCKCTLHVAAEGESEIEGGTKKER